MGKYSALERRVERLDLRMKQRNIDNMTFPYPTAMIGDKVLSQGDPHTDPRWSTPKMVRLPAVIKYVVVKPEDTAMGRTLIEEAKGMAMHDPADKDGLEELTESVESFQYEPVDPEYDEDAVPEVIAEDYEKPQNYSRGRRR